MLKTYICSILILLATQLGTAFAAPQPAPVSPLDNPYMDAWTFFGRPGSGSMTAAEYGTTVSALGQEFGGICGDTFCDGTYGNLTALSFDCSIDAGSGTIGECIWTFAGTATTIDPATGHLAVAKQVYACTLPIKGNAEQLATFLRAAATTGDTGFDGLDAVAIPGSQATLMGTLLNCL